MKQTPYDTGKVKIGCRYEPKVNHVTPEGEFWQGVFLGVYAQRQQQAEQMMCYLAGLVGFFALVWWIA